LDSVQLSLHQAWKRLVVILAMLAIVSTAPGSVAATDGAPIVSLGESNSEVQQEEVLDFLDAANTDTMVTVTVDETVQSMGGVFDVSGIDTAYSSTALTCQAGGAGIAVRTRNIEAIPPELYALALLTAGMSDVQLAVAAPDDARALGMTAMTGVFKTWDLASCPGSGSDPLRRQLALEELALVAEIGQEPEGIRQTTLVVLKAQQEIIGNHLSTEELDALVASESERAGLHLTDTDQASIVAFLDKLSGAGIAWGEFTNGWSTQYADDGSSVVLVANAVQNPPDAPETVPSGVGGVTGPITSAATPTPPASPTVMDSVPVNAGPPSTPTGDNDARSTVIGTLQNHGHDAGRWWPVAVVGVALLLIGIGARLQPSERVQTWYVSRSRVFWLGRTLRRPPVIQSPQRKRQVVIHARR
jgi:uncharacterized protein YpuA (DUF1002 family)